MTGVLMLVLGRVLDALRGAAEEEGAMGRDEILGVMAPRIDMMSWNSETLPLLLVDVRNVVLYTDLLLTDVSTAVALVVSTAVALVVDVRSGTLASGMPIGFISADRLNVMVI